MELGDVIKNDRCEYVDSPICSQFTFCPQEEGEICEFINRQEITICIGLPSSGKTTWAKDNRDSDTIIIDCDDIRKMLSGANHKYDSFLKENEGIVWSTFDFILKKAFDDNRKIIIANTNTNLKRLKDLISTIPDNYIIDFAMQSVVVGTCHDRISLHHGFMHSIIDNMSMEMKATVDWILNQGFNFNFVYNK